MVNLELFFSLSNVFPQMIVGEADGEMFAISWRISPTLTTSHWWGLARDLKKSY